MGFLTLLGLLEQSSRLFMFLGFLLLPPVDGAPGDTIPVAGDRDGMALDKVENLQTNPGFLGEVMDFGQFGNGSTLKAFHGAGRSQRRLIDLSFPLRYSSLRCRTSFF